jgi:hypothetical protein
VGHPILETDHRYVIPSDFESASVFEVLN